MTWISVQRDNRGYLCIGYEDGTIEIRDTMNLENIEYTGKFVHSPVKQVIFPCSYLFGIICVLFERGDVVVQHIKLDYKNKFKLTNDGEKKVLRHGLVDGDKKFNKKRMHEIKFRCERYLCIQTSAINLILYDLNMALEYGLVD